MYSHRFLMITSLLFSILNIASAQDTKLFTPQPEHELLKRFAGEWDFEKKSVPGDGSTPQTVGFGKIKAELLGGFFVVSNWSGNIYGTDFKGVQTIGYDVNKKKYVGSWVDSVMSHRWQFSGSFEPKSKELVITASGPIPTGEMKQFRERYQFNTADSITVVAEILQDEKWGKFMTTQLTRKKKQKAD